MPSRRPETPAPAAALGATRKALRARLASVGARYRAVLRLGLTRPGRLLTGATPPWASLPLACAQAVGGAWQPAVPVAVAMELTAAALELLDDIEDGELEAEDPMRALTPARQMNVSTGLLTLALSTLPGTTGQALAAAVLVAATGQDGDLAGEGVPVSERQCLEIAIAKTATLTRCAARLGALAAGAPEAIVERFGEFGHHLGLAGQLANDLQAADLTTPHSDLVRRKPTVLLAAAGLTGPAGDDASTIAPALVHRLHASGAVNYTWLLAESARQEALVILDQLAQQGLAIAPLRLFARPTPLPGAPAS